MMTSTGYYICWLKVTVPHIPSGPRLKNLSLTAQGKW